MFKLDHSICTAAAGALSVALMASAAYAFNPQPDLPTKRLTLSNALKQKSGNPSGRRSVSPGSCRAGGQVTVAAGPCRAR